MRCQRLHLGRQVGDGPGVRFQPGLEGLGPLAIERDGRKLVPIIEREIAAIALDVQAVRVFYRC